MPLRLLSSLKARLALAGAGLTAASVLIGAWAALKLVDAHLGDALLDGEAAQARTLARVASNRLVARQLLLRRIAQDLPPLGPSGQVNAWLQGKTALLGTFDSLFVTTPAGAGIAQVDAGGLRTSPAVSVADRPYFRQTVEQRLPRISDPVESRVSGRPAIILTQPEFAPDGTLRAVLGASLRLDTRDLLADLTGDDRSDDSGHVTAIIDRSGRLIAHTDASLLLQPAERDARLAPAIAAWRAGGSAFDPDGLALHRDERYVGLAGIAAAEWIVVRSIDDERVLGGLAQARRRAIALMLATALLGGAALWAATYWLMRPFDALKRRAAAISLLDSGGDAPPWPRLRGEIGGLARVLRDVEQRHHADARERARLLQQMHSVLEHAAVGLLVTVDRRMVLVSGTLCRQFGYAEDELVGQPARMLFPSDAAYDALGPQVAKAFAEQGLFDTELEFVKRDGSPMWGRLLGRPVEQGNPAAGTIWVIDDVGAMREQRAQLEWASTHDALTRLANRTAFEQALDRQLADRRAATAHRPFCVMLLDLDFFKAVNDSGGHAAGDALLHELSALMAKRLRRSDLLARFGGDEFAALLVDCDRDTALKVAESIREQVAHYRLLWQGMSYGVGVSIGVVEVGAQHADRAAVMAAADDACYEAKGAGRNQVRAG